MRRHRNGRSRDFECRCNPQFLPQQTAHAQSLPANVCTTLASPAAAAAAAAAASPVLVDVRTPPCVLRAAARSVLLTVSDDRVLDVGLHAARNSSGQLFTDNRHSQVNVFDRSGKFVRTLGRVGGGPGEFGTGAMRLAFDASDRLYIRHGNRLWNVYSKSGDFLHATSAGQQAFGWETACLTGSGVLVTSEELMPNGASQTYNLATRASQTTDKRISVRSEVPQALACVTGERYWIGKPSTGRQASGAYTLELRSITGERMRSLTRPAPWFRNRTASVVGSAGKAGPSIAMLAANNAGLLLVVATIPNDKIRDVKPGLSRALRDSARDAAIDVYIDVIDQRAGRLIATVGPIRPSELKRTWFGGIFPGSFTGYRREETAETVSALRLVDLKLIAR